MLVLSRRVGERILVGDKVRITVVRVSGGGVRLGIEAPSDVTVVREEVAVTADEATPKSDQPKPKSSSKKSRKQKIVPASQFQATGADLPAASD